MFLLTRLCFLWKYQQPKMLPFWFLEKQLSFCSKKATFIQTHSRITLIYICLQLPSSPRKTLLSFQNCDLVWLSLQFCVKNKVDYLTIRVYIGFWLFIISLIVSCFEGSVLVKLFTRFISEIFASLISLLYIMDSVTQIFSVSMTIFLSFIQIPWVFPIKVYTSSTLNHFI